MKNEIQIPSKIESISIVENLIDEISTELSLEADLYGCSDPCWWPTQVPDTSSSYKNWADKAPSSKDDWRELENVYPKI